MKAVSCISAAALALGLAAAPAAAQLLGNPVYVSPKGGTGVTISGDYGRGLNTNSGKGNSFNGRVTLGLPMVQIQVGAGSYKPKGGVSTANFMGQAAIRLLGGGPMPANVSLFAGAGYASKSGTKTLTVPAGVAIGLNVPSPSVSVEPWIAPRINYMHVSVAGISSSQSKFGISGGVNLGLPMGLGFHAALDYVAISGAAPLTFGIGVHYKFTVPGLGEMGM